MLKSRSYEMNNRVSNLSFRAMTRMFRAADFFFPKLEGGHQRREKTKAKIARSGVWQIVGKEKTYVGVSLHRTRPAGRWTGTRGAHFPASSRRPGPGSCGQAGLAVGQVSPDSSRVFREESGLGPIL